MLYLFLSIVGGVAAGIAYKASVEMGCRRLHHLLVERFAVVAGTLVLGIVFGGMALTADVVVLGLVAGISLFVSRWALLKALSTGHAGVTFTLWHLAIVVPVVLSIFLWGEVPSRPQVAGLLLVPACLLLMRERMDRSAPPRTLKAISVALYPALLCAGGEGVFATCFKLVDVLEMNASRNLFLVLYNLVAVTGIASVVGLRGVSLPRRKEYRSGLFSGFGFACGGFFGMLAVLEIPAIIYFPVMAAGGLVLTVLCASLIWREHTSPAQRWGIALSVVAIVLVSLG